MLTAIINYHTDVKYNKNPSKTLGLQLTTVGHCSVQL